jgi:apolipoprotein N-acyltransferase
LHNKLGNAHDLLGVPWSMLEYSQYRQLPLIQVASLVGGVGIGALLVMSNTAMAGLVATVSRKLAWKSLAARTTGDSVRQLLCVALLVAVVCAWGASTAGGERLGGTLPASVIQGNINIDMQKTEHRYTLAELLKQQAELMQRCPPGLCILAENAVPTYLRNERAVAADLAAMARRRQVDLVVGCLDRDSEGRPYNSAFGIAHDGALLPDAYHKRYLVPFGEYAPALVEYMPEWIRRLTNTPAGGGFAAGKQPVVLALPSGKIAPLICFETISPEVVAASVRKGGTLLVNLSDLAWFHDSMIGDQMLAFAVVRAVENGRYFVFAANSGPSAIIEPSGRIAARSPAGQPAVLIGKTANGSKITPFTFWFR